MSYLGNKDNVLSREFFLKLPNKTNLKANNNDENNNDVQI